VSIISWNIRDFGQSRDSNEIYQIAILLRDADLVAIQEVVAKHPGGAQAVARLVDQLERMGANWDYCISDPTKSPSSYISERYAYLWKPSKLKMIGQARLLSELTDNVYREPYLGHFKTDDKDFFVLNYHSRTHVEGDEEISEFGEISSWINQQQLQSILWLGDFNLESKHTAYNAFYSIGFQQVFKDQKTTLKMKCENGNYLSLGEDNIFIKSNQLTYSHPTVIDFIKSNCNNLAELTKAYSDHLPLNVFIRD